MPSFLIQQPDWKCRHAALMAISAAGEGCHKQMEGYLNQIMEAVMQFVNDPHPRVRFACCNALGQMATDFAPVFEKKFHDKVIPGLLHLMDDNANPRVQVNIKFSSRDAFWNAEYYHRLSIITGKCNLSIFCRLTLVPRW